MNESSIKEFIDICQQLSHRVNLYSAEGKQLYPENQQDINMLLWKDNNEVFQRLGTHIFMRTTTPLQHIISTEYKDSLSCDILLLINQMLSNSGNNKHKISNKKEAYQHIISESDISPLQIKEIATNFKIPSNANYCILYINFKSNLQKSIDLIKELYPLKSNDVFFPLGPRSNVIVHYTDDYGVFDVNEFIYAFNETILEESGEQFSIGVSEIKDNVLDIRKAFVEAKRAYSIGERIYNNCSVYFYSNLILERLILELNPQIRQSYLSKMFNEENRKILNEEMISTINAFLNKDLNLSDASRHLYIHRNTLVYRLDKIQKSSGLDLRKFNDAVIFKILSTMQKLTKLDKE